MVFDCFSRLNASITKPHTLSRTAACPDRELWTIWKVAWLLKTLNPLNTILSTPYFPSPTAFRFPRTRRNIKWLVAPVSRSCCHLFDLHALSDGRLVFVCLLALCAVKARCVSSRARRKTCNCFHYNGCTTVTWVLWRNSFLKKSSQITFSPLTKKKKADGLLCTDIFPSLLHILQSLNSPRHLIGLVHSRLVCPLLVEALFSSVWCQLQHLGPLLTSSFTHSLRTILCLNTKLSNRN